MTSPAVEGSPRSRSDVAIGAEGVTKGFPGVRALDQVTFEVARGEIHSLVGENGAGKSTLVKILGGLLKPDAGDLVLDGRGVSLHSPRAARQHGISVIPQEVLFVPRLSVGRNLLLGNEGFWVRRNGLAADEQRRAHAALQQVGVHSPPSHRSSRLAIAELRLCQIAKTLTSPGDVIVCDEPTAVLSEADALDLLERLMRLRDQGKAIVYVSHRLSEVLRISDRITVLRDGKVVGTFLREQATREALVSLMAKPTESIALDAPRLARPQHDANPLLEVQSLAGPGFEDVSLDLHRGQIVGIAGVQGAGHGALLRALAGAAPTLAGSVHVDGVALPAGSVLAAFQQGIVLLPSDRRREGIVALRSLRDNVVLPPRPRYSFHGMRRRDVERDVADGYKAELKIRAPTIETLAGALSGGNQQKLALARALGSDARILLLEEPTQGVDVGAKLEVWRLIRQVCRTDERCALIASSEFEELLEIADVIYVMRLGRLVAQMPREEATYESILHHALP